MCTVYIHLLFIINYIQGANSSGVKKVTTNQVLLYSELNLASYKQANITTNIAHYFKNKLLTISLFLHVLRSLWNMDSLPAAV